MQEGVAGLTRDKTRPPRLAPLPAETVDRMIEPYWGSWGVVLSGRIGGLGGYGNRSERVGRSPVG